MVGTGHLVSARDLCPLVSDDAHDLVSYSKLPLGCQNFLWQSNLVKGDTGLHYLVCPASSFRASLLLSEHHPHSVIYNCSHIKRRWRQTGWLYFTLFSDVFMHSETEFKETALRIRTRILLK
jgi:hypothetical protein